MAVARPKGPREIDRYVGQRVRARRMDIGMSQETLGIASDLTFQQIQKYEKGANRISASRLVELANTLRVPVTYFFEGVPTGSNGKTDPSQRRYATFVAEQDGAKFMEAIEAVSDEVRTAYLAVGRVLGKLP